MKFVCTKVNESPRIGIILGEEVALLPEPWSDLVTLIEGGAETRGEVERLVARKDAQRVPLAGLDLLAPVRRFRRDILCTGWNYWDHFEEGQGKREGQDAPERPKAPTFFTKGPDAVIGPRDPIAFDPRLSSRWDYEAELVVVFGKAGRSIPASRAMEHVFGYCLANDVSQRDLQRRHGGQWLKGKSIDGTTPIGPCVVTPEEIDDLQNLRLECLVNGEQRQSARIAQMAFPIEELIAEVSFGMTVRPGDLLLTGTPSGVGYARTPPALLAEGDEVVIRAQGIGELRNKLVRADLFGQSSVLLD